MNELKPCPFCGSSNIDPDFSSGYAEGDFNKPCIAAGCWDCSACGPQILVPNGEDGHKESIKAWNTRHE